MPEKIVLTNDAVFVSQAFPNTNFSFLNKIKVGSNIPLSHYQNNYQNCDGQNIGLIEFDGFMIPKDFFIESAKLYMFVSYTQNYSEQIYIYKNIDTFDKYSVTFNTRPSIFDDKNEVLLVNKKDTCNYVNVDITEFLVNSDGFINPLSLSLFGFGTSIFNSNFYNHPIYLMVNYKKRENCNFNFNYANNIFYEKVFDINEVGIAFTDMVNLKDAKTVTFFVKNLGNSTLNINLQYSPNGIDFINDPQNLTLNPLEFKAVTPYLFSKFIRMQLTTKDESPILANVHCQIQTYNYSFE